MPKRKSTFPSPELLKIFSWILLPVVEDVVDILLSGRSRHDRRPGAPRAVAEGRLLAVETIREVVVEPVVSEALVDGEADVVEACDLHDDLAPVVVDGVEGGVADNLVHADHRLVGHVGPGDVVAVKCHLMRKSKEKNVF